MGGTSFENEYRGTATMAEAYRELVDQAFYDNGHDPYNGTISTTSGCIQDPNVREPMTYAEAQLHLFGDRADPNSEAWWDRDESPQKWEAAWAIPLKPTPEGEAVGTNPWGPPFDQSQPGWLFYGIAAC